MEIIQHILGVCPDTNSHFDLLDLFTKLPFNDVLSIMNSYMRLCLERIISIVK